MKRRGEKHVGTGREKLPSITKIYIFGKSTEKEYIYLL